MHQNFRFAALRKRVQSEICGIISGWMRAGYLPAICDEIDQAAGSFTDVPLSSSAISWSLRVSKANFCDSCIGSEDGISTRWGSTGCPFCQNLKQRCGPVARPVLPT
jgi:hypothetical protein